MAEQLIYFVAVFVATISFLTHKVCINFHDGKSIVGAIGEITDDEVLEIVWDTALFVGLVSTVLYF